MLYTTLSALYKLSQSLVLILLMGIIIPILLGKEKTKAQRKRIICKGILDSMNPDPILQTSKLYCLSRKPWGRSKQNL